MANAPIATAFVEIVPVLTRFAQKVKADVQDALQAADDTMAARTGRMVQRAGDKITKLGDATAKFGASWTRNITAPIALTSAAIFKVGGDFEESLSRIVG